MNAHFATLDLPPNSSLEAARDAYFAIAEKVHPDNNANNKYAYTRNQARLDIVEAAWYAVQVSFHDQLGASLEYVPAFEKYYSEAELLTMAKEAQEYRREQPRGAIRVRQDEKLVDGMYEEYERQRVRNKGYVFDGEASVTRKDGVDTIIGSPTFKNTTFTNNVKFMSKPIPTKSTSGPLRFPKGAPLGAASVATFEGHIIFEEDVEFEVEVIYEGQVEFKKAAVFKKLVTFYKEPIFSARGVQHRAVREAWM